MRSKFMLGVVMTALATAVSLGKTTRQGDASSKGKRPVLVELFTSEGCSSCPPADDLLRQIDGKTTNEGALVIGVSEHVTYWDHDGWKDPYDSDAITNRQNDYGQKFHIESVYTPQMVVNGETQIVGSDGKGLLQAVLKAQADDGPTVNIGSAKLNGNAVDAVVSVAGDVPKHGADVFAVVAHDETTEHVLRGENQGKTLSHASVARTLTKVGKIHGAGDTTVHVGLPTEIVTATGGKRHLIVWVQEPNAGRVLGVDSKSF